MSSTLNVNVNEVKRLLSGPRFESYRSSPTDSDMLCLERYSRNLALCEALYPTIHILEVALRNAIHNACTTAFGNDYWFDDPQRVSNARAIRIISSAKQNLVRATKPIEANRIVAELHFGFWRALFFKEYEQKLWRHIVKDVFPNAPKSMQQRSQLGGRIHRAKELRNRIFHHEPIWHWSDLKQQHEEALETLLWIGSSMHTLAVECDRFPAVHSRGAASLSKALISELNAQTKI